MYQSGSEGMLQQLAGPAMQAGMAYATGGLTGMGALGRGAMDAYRNKPSGQNSAYANLFNRRQNMGMMSQNPLMGY
jgi:hypothetical protein